MCSRMVKSLSEINEIDSLVNKAKVKYNSSKSLYGIDDYSDSVSLSYYSMYLMAKSLLILKGYRPKTHRGLITQFKQVYVDNCGFNYNIYKHLARTQSLRESADYDAFDGITKNMAYKCINQAEEFMKEAERFL